MLVQRRFSSPNDAFDYLRYWMGDPVARVELKGVLQRCRPSLVSPYAGSDGWLWTLAVRLASGAIIVIEERAQTTRPGRLVGPTVPGLSAADLAALPFLSELLPVLSIDPAPPASAATPAPAKPTPDVYLPASDDFATQMADQLAQAETLERAAETGTPFCEICEQNRLARLEVVNE
jgi:hypothetical protein